MQKDKEQEIEEGTADNEARPDDVRLDVNGDKEDPPHKPGCLGIGFFDWSDHWRTAANKESWDSLKKKLLPRHQSKVYTEGTPPRLGRPTIYDVHAHPDFVESTLKSKDLQMVKIGVRVLTRSGQNFNKGVLPSIIYETVKAVVAEYSASELITQRETVSTMIKKVLTDKARNTGIPLDDVSITSLCLLAEEENDEKAGQDNTSTIIRAHGDDTWDKMQVYLTIALVVGLTILLMIQPFMPPKYLSFTIGAFATVWVLGSIALLLGLFGTNRYEKEFSRHIGRLTFMCFCIFVLYVLYLVSKPVRKGISSHASSPSSAPSETTIDGRAWFFIILGVVAVIGHTYSWVMGCCTGSDL